MELKEQYDRIYQYLYFRLRDRQAAEDLTQEAFLRFLTSRTYRDENITGTGRSHTAWMRREIIR